MLSWLTRDLLTFCCQICSEILASLVAEGELSDVDGPTGAVGGSSIAALGSALTWSNQLPGLGSLLSQVLGGIIPLVLPGT